MLKDKILKIPFNHNWIEELKDKKDKNINNKIVRCETIRQKGGYDCHKAEDKQIKCVRVENLNL